MPLWKPTHRAPLPRKGITDGCEDCGGRHGLPRRRKYKPQKEKWPGRADQINEIARECGHQEGEKCPAASPMIR